MNNSIHDIIYDLIARKIAGEAAAEDLAELSCLLAQYPDFQFLHDQLVHMGDWGKFSADEATSQAYASQYVKMMYAGRTMPAPILQENKKAKAGRMKPVLQVITAIAAAVVCFVFMARFWNNSSMTTTQANLVSTDTVSPEKSKLLLPDGTIVYLNKHSHLVYSKDFGVTNREVTLTGEAYFDVAHNKHLPFFVNTPKATIKVLGTAFNVKSYEGENWEASLIRGKIEMYVKDKPRETLQLSPSQKVAIIEEPHQDALAKNADYKVAITQIKTLEKVVAETAWMDNSIVLVDKPFVEVAHDFERKFGIKVVFKSPKTKGYRYTGAFKNDSLQKILQILNLAKPIHYTLSDDMLIVE